MRLVVALWGMMLGYWAGVYIDQLGQERGWSRATRFWVALAAGITIGLAGRYML